MGQTLAQMILFLAIFAYLNRQLHHTGLVILLIALELILLSIGQILVHASYQLDDGIGNLQTLYLLPLAGCESAIGQAQQIKYTPFVKTT